MLKKNVGSLDRILRLVVGVAALAAYFMMPGLGWGIILLIVGIIAIATALMSSCLLYTIFGLNTGPSKNAE